MTLAELVRAMEDRAHAGRYGSVLATAPHMSYLFDIVDVEFDHSRAAILLRLSEVPKETP